MSELTIGKHLYVREEGGILTVTATGPGPAKAITLNPDEWASLEAFANSRRSQAPPKLEQSAAQLIAVCRSVVESPRHPSTEAIRQAAWNLLEAAIVNAEKENGR